MQKFHLKSPSFARFCLLQFVPSMYNFANETAVSTFEVAGDPFAGERQIRLQTNHYPLRFVTFGLNNRRELLKDGTDKYVYLRSRFRTQELSSLYLIEPENNKLYVRRIR